MRILKVITLFDKELANTINPLINSVRLTGQVVFESPNVFTITPKEMRVYLETIQTQQALEKYPIWTF